MSEEVSIVLFARVPKHSDLCCVIATINSEPKKDKLINDYHCQILKCRCLIFTEPEVIASPVLGAIKQIYVIVSRTFYESRKLNHHLEKLNMKGHQPMPVTNTVYESCLRYTFLARLAPSWNQVDKYLIQGRDFLKATTPLNAVKLDIVMTV
uniref:DUF4708 domain-containing protein n=1 Tax=Clastoptera arizonana TaxID=38151 RepID=A0A1B6CIA3_9HEMI